MLAGIIGGFGGLFWLLVALLIGFYVYGDAQKRGHDSPILWGLIGFLFSVIGLIVWVILRPEGESYQLNEMRDDVGGLFGGGGQ